MKDYRLWIAFGLISLVLLACNLTNLITTATKEVPKITSQGELQATQKNGMSPQMLETPAPTLDQLAAARACLVGTWEIDNLSSYVVAAIPPDLTTKYNLRYKETSGSATLTLTPDGRILLHFNGLIFLFDANVSVFTVPLTVGLDGDVNGDYSLNGNILSTTNMDASGLIATAQALGQDVVDSAMIVSVIPLVQPPFNTAVYNCSGDTLQLEFPAYPENVPPLVFQRVK